MLPLIKFPTKALIQGGKAASHSGSGGDDDLIFVLIFSIIIGFAVAWGVKKFLNKRDKTKKHSKLGFWVTFTIVTLFFYLLSSGPSTSSYQVDEDEYAQRVREKMNHDNQKRKEEIEKLKEESEKGKEKLDSFRNNRSSGRR